MKLPKVQLKGLSLTSATYIEARDLLNRYMNTHFLVSAYMKKLVLLPAICRESDVRGLRLLHEQVECNMQNLHFLDADILFIGFCLCHL